MATLKGQNFRILRLVNSRFEVIAMATNCTVTLTGNTEEASSKEDVGLAAKPTVTSKSWSVSVESLSTYDVTILLQIMKEMTPVTLMWDETQTTNNQALASSSVQRIGTAYLNDATFNFNDRENAAKSLQFTGCSALTHDTQVSSSVISAPGYTKGQYVRLFLSSDNTAVPTRVIAAAKNLSLHVSLTLEDATTKDTEGNWAIQEPTALSYDITTTALMRSGETISSDVGAQTLADLEAIYEMSSPVKWQIANVSGANQRTKGDIIASGSVIVTQLTLNGQNRQKADYSAQLTGYGDYNFLY